MEVVILIIVLALIFDFYNGMNDAANSIATIVSTRVLTPFQAVAWAAFFNFVAAFAFGVGVATTIGKGIVDVNIVNNFVNNSVKKFVNIKKVVSLSHINQLKTKTK